jgi:2-polyprenyl-3-methyl-5-hydroxy-6-metoxy-1,4-benzoquinol methylase
MEEKDYINTNRNAWNEVSSIHERHTFAQIVRNLKTGIPIYLDPTVSALLKKLDCFDKSVAQLCCNNGRELLSIKLLGAGFCIGFDFSEEFIKQAKRLAAETQIECRFVCSEVTSIPADYDASFDLVFIPVKGLIPRRSAA